MRLFTGVWINFGLMECNILAFSALVLVSTLPEWIGEMRTNMLKGKRLCSIGPKLVQTSVFCILFVWASLFASSPFEMDMRELENKELTSEDYVEIQKRIRQIDLRSLLKEKYESECKAGHFAVFDDFWGRCTKSIHQILIDPEKEFFPERKLVKINNGGDRCVVCCVPFGGKYPGYLKTLAEGLRETGFNGYFLYYLGGWPNPTGKEIRYVAVPYSFKIFAMVEAQRLGFNRVLWVDSACYPLKNIEPLFDIIAKNGALLNWAEAPSDSAHYIFPKTRQLLSDLTGVNVLRAKFINSIVMGIKMDSPEAARFVQKYYELAELGEPFLSCFPEEFVFTAIINDGTYPNWIASPPPKLVKASKKNADDSAKEFDLMRRKGVFFYQRKGR